MYRSANARGHRSEQEQFEICLGAILTQNTNWRNVSAVLSGLKRDNLLRLDRFMALPKRRMERHLRSSGYFRQKTKRVRTFFRWLRKNHAGRFHNLFSRPTLEVRRTLLALPGIGPETADSILLYAAGRPVFVVDAYTRRIGQRWGVLNGSESYDEIQRVFAGALRASAARYNETHALIVKLAKDHCRTEPHCHECPLRRLCRFGRHH